jgi:cytochrome P450
MRTVLAPREPGFWQAHEQQPASGFGISPGDPLRPDSEAIPNFIEECLRFESPIKGSFRLALRDVEIAGVAVPAGSILMT